MTNECYEVEFLFRPMQKVNYLVEHPNGCIDQSLPLCDSDDLVRYTFFVYAPSSSAALAIGTLLLADAVREDYHPDAYADVVSASVVFVDD